MSILRSLRLLVLLLAAGVLVAACGSGSGYGGSSKKSSAPKATSSAMVDSHHGPHGTYVTDGKGRSLYLLTSDGRNKSSCTGACAAAWPPFTTTGKAMPMGSVHADDLGTIKRSDGTVQVTLYGHPLYYYAQDSKPGDTNGQGIKSYGGTWWLVAPSGKAITSGSSSSSDNGGGYGGY